jgi:hypothetical protein
MQALQSCAQLIQFGASMNGCLSVPTGHHYTPSTKVSERSIAAALIHKYKKCSQEIDIIPCQLHALLLFQTYHVIKKQHTHSLRPTSVPGH